MTGFQRLFVVLAVLWAVCSTIGYVVVVERQGYWTSSQVQRFLFTPRVIPMSAAEVCETFPDGLCTGESKLSRVVRGYRVVGFVTLVFAPPIIGGALFWSIGWVAAGFRNQRGTPLTVGSARAPAPGEFQVHAENLFVAAPARPDIERTDPAPASPETEALRPLELDPRSDTSRLGATIASGEEQPIVANEPGQLLPLNGPMKLSQGVLFLCGLYWLGQWGGLYGAARGAGITRDAMATHWVALPLGFYLAMAVFSALLFFSLGSREPGVPRMVLVYSIIHVAAPFVVAWLMLSAANTLTAVTLASGAASSIAGAVFIVPVAIYLNLSEYARRVFNSARKRSQIARSGPAI